jgi:flagellar basal-body rod protein FlgB
MDRSDNRGFERLPMDIQKIPVFKMMAAKMQWLEHRQRVLAQNVSNSDTPGYVPHDLKKLDFRKSIQKDSFRLQLATTSAAHMPGGIQKTAFGAEQKSKNNYETSPTGNAVILEEQMIKVADTAAEHQLMTNLYKKQLGMFRIALGRQSGG